jgi:hypothetical protein
MQLFFKNFLIFPYDLAIGKDLRTYNDVMCVKLYVLLSVFLVQEFY